ncbi:MAG: putative Ig domain-containing protein [Acidimicrobiales bacterium]
MTRNGEVSAFGGARFLGPTGGPNPSQPVVGIASTPDGAGYWLAGAGGAVVAYGDASFFGSATKVGSGEPVVGIASTPDGKGYWLAGGGGRVLAFGNAHLFGSEDRAHSKVHIVDLARTPDGKGYWLVAANGRVFAFGDARLFGKVAARSLRQGVSNCKPAGRKGTAVAFVTACQGQTHPISPTVGIAATADGGGYWLAAANGSVFAFGDARSFGSMKGRHLTGRVVGIAATADGGGYWLAAANGSVFAFGDATYAGSIRPTTHGSPLVAMAANPIAVSSQALTILTQSLAPASAGSPYRASLGAAGGLPPYSWKVVNGQLPQGLALDSATGTIEGAVTGPAVALLTITVSDRRGAVATTQLTLVAGLSRAPLRPGDGGLAVSIDQLPPGVAAAITVRGPGGFDRSLSATTELVVPPGSYVVSARPVNSGTDTYYPAITGSPAEVIAGRLSVAGVSYLTEVADTTKVVKPADLSDLRSMSAQSMIFSPPPASLAGVQAGDVVVAGPSANAPGGFLRRVTSVSQADGELVFGTVAAGLAQAVPRGSFSVNWPPNTASAAYLKGLVSQSAIAHARAQVSGPGVTTAWPWKAPLRAAGNVSGSHAWTPGGRTPTRPHSGVCSSAYPCQFTVTPPGSPLACGYASGSSAPANPADPISVNLSPSFSITPHLDASWSFPTHLQADAYVEVTERVAVSATVQADVVCQYTAKLWGPQTFGIPDINFSIGPVPVNISVLLEIDATLKGQASSQITVPTETQGFTLQAGVSYDSQASPNFQPINVFRPDNSFSPPTGSGYLKASVGPKVTFAFYCYDTCFSQTLPDGSKLPAITAEVGPQVGIDGYVKADLKSSAPTWDVAVGFEASIGFVASWLGFTLSAQFTIPIYTAYLASEPPEFESSSVLATDETGPLAQPFTAYMAAAGFTKQASYVGPPPVPPPTVPLVWALGNCQLTPGGYNGYIPGSSPPKYLLVSSDGSDGTVTLPQLPASDAGLNISFDAQVTDSLGQCSTKTFTIPIIAGPHAQIYPLANPEIGVPYRNFLELAMLGLFGEPSQGGTPPYTCPAPPKSKRGYSQDPSYPAFADGVALSVSPSTCTVSGTVSASTDPSVIAGGMNQPLYVEDALNGVVWDTLQMGPIAQPVALCAYDTSTAACPQWQLQSQQPSTVTAEVGVPFAAPVGAALGVPPYSYGIGTCGQYGYSSPPGILIGQNGTLSGTPTQSGSYQFPVYAVDQEGGCAWTWLYLDVVAQVDVPPSSLRPAEVGVPYDSGALVATGGLAPYTWQVASVVNPNGDSVPLPAGLSVDPATGEITGTPGSASNDAGKGAPEPGTAGSYRVELTVTDRIDGTAVETLPLVIAPPLAIASPVQLPPSTKGLAYSASLQSSGGTGTTAWSLIGGSLPHGLTLSTGGVISGTPAPDASTAVVSVQVTDSAGGSAVSELVLPVGVAITTVSLPEAEVAVPYSFRLQAAGGKPAYSWRLAAGSGPLPTGLSLSAAGIVSGTPVNSATGAYPLAVQVGDAGGGRWTSSFTFDVAAPPAVEAALLPADVHAGYSDVPTVIGGVAPFSWSLVPGSGSLPPGLSLDGEGLATGTTGLVHGTPSTLGNYLFELQVTDAAGVSATGPAEISVLPGPQVTTTYLPDANVGVPYTASVVAAGGLSTQAVPYQWRLGVGDMLPDGLALSPDGTISGTPAADSVGTSSVVHFTVVDYWGTTATATLSLRVDQPLALSALALPEAEVGLPYWTQVEGEGGYPPYTWSTVGTPPPGLQVSEGNILSGTPTQAGYDTGLILCATDSARTPGCTSPGLKVAPPVVVATPSLPNEPAGGNFSIGLQASGGVLGTVGYDWSLPATATAYGYPLPPWLSLTGGGQLTGDAPPDAAGQSFQVPVQVSDSLGAFATATLTLAIGWPAPLSAPTTTSGPPPPTSLPELTMQNVAVPSSAQAGASIQVSWTVDNTGAAQAAGTWQDSVYLGTTAGALTTLLARFPEPPSPPVTVGGSYTDTEPVTIPAGTGAGSYFVTVVANANEALTESSYVNGSGSAAITVTATSAQPTLRAVTSVEANATAIAVGDGGTVLTYDGSSWTAQASGTTDTLYGVSYDGIGSANAWAVGDHGTILATTSNGSSWSVDNSGTTQTLYGISCPTTSTCWAVGAGGTVLATTNGSTWSSQSSGTTEPLYGVYCFSVSECWAVGAGGTVLVSTDSGSTWSAESSGTTNDLRSVSCVYSSGVSQTCWAVGAGGTVLVSSDSGSTWSAESSGTTDNLYAVEVGGYCGLAGVGDCVMAAGAGGTLLDYGTSWGAVASGTIEDLYGFAYLGPYFSQYAAVGAGETEVTGTPLGA